jgi:FMN phosphatase YigB (HAD superfamily)
MPMVNTGEIEAIHSHLPLSASLIGVLWLGEQAIAGSSDFIAFLASKGKRIIVLTNNATKSRAVYAKKLAQLGYGRCINEVRNGEGKIPN